MTVFVDKNKLELEILAGAVSDRAQARTVLGICDRASWSHDVAYTAIEQVARHGKILDQHVRDHPHVRDAHKRRLNMADAGTLDKLCWNHCCIANSDAQMTLLRITGRRGYEDLGMILETILMANLENLEQRELAGA